VGPPKLSTKETCVVSFAIMAARRFIMSFQAYLDNIELKTGKTPNEFIALAAQKGFGPDTRAGEIVTWLKDEFGLGHGHAMAMVHVIKKGPVIDDKHVNSGGVHGDDSNTLKLDGLKNRS
jgi:hypothetical protein